MIQILNDVATEGMVGRIAQNGTFVNAGGYGIGFQQYKAGTALANSNTETSLFTLAALAPQILGSQPLAAASTAGSLLGIPANFLSLGTGFKGELFGTIANTGTPTIRVRVVLKNSAGTVVYTLSDTTATTMGSITGTTELVVAFDAVCSAVGTSGAMIGRVAVKYGTSATANSDIKAAPASVAVDTTQQYSLDVLATWGAASSSNTLNILIGTVGIY